MSATDFVSIPDSVLAGKYLTVVLDNEAYGFAVLKVREIIRMLKITLVPQMPEYVKGVINLRGRVIPVVDLRVKFGLKAGFTDRTCIVVVHLAAPKGQARPTLGLIVDSVEEVLDVTTDMVESTPEFGTAFIDTKYLLGMVKVKEEIKTLLDIDRVFTTETVATLEEVGG